MKRRAFLLTVTALFLFATGKEAYPRFSLDNRWKQLETKHTVIQYENFEDLKDFDSSIDYSPDGFSFRNLFSVGNPDDPAGSLARKLDALYEKVQQILDMRGTLKKVRINIYPDRERLRQAYSTITGEACRLRAWYIFEVNTIYVNKDDVDEGIIAHEMAHSIIDHYFSVRPPEATAEILATYVDQHLSD